jgi:hypothetical protein
MEKRFFLPHVSAIFLRVASGKMVDVVLEGKQGVGGENNKVRIYFPCRCLLS